jgi:single-strand DNA-binding protein
MKTIGFARLGRDAEVRYAPSGDAVVNLSIAFNYGKADDGGNRPTQWIEAALWGKRAESLAQYLVKGSVHNFYLSDVHIETYQGQNGQGHKMVGRVDDIELGPRGQAGGGGSERQDSGSQRQQRQAPPKQSGGGFDEMDDDIPF